LSEQYFTSFQFFSHFLRQAIGLPQARHALVGRKDLLPKKTGYLFFKTFYNGSTGYADPATTRGSG
jgi:hypothetical protein